MEDTATVLVVASTTSRHSPDTLRLQSRRNGTRCRSLYGRAKPQGVPYGEQLAATHRQPIAASDREPGRRTCGSVNETVRASPKRGASPSLQLHFVAGSGSLCSPTMESIWIAVLYISQATATKIAGKHDMTVVEVRDALVCVSGLPFRWDDSPRARLTSSRHNDGPRLRGRARLVSSR